jgi:hypothetical protein
MEVGPGGRQIQVEDTDGNLIELFEPARATWNAALYILTLQRYPKATRKRLLSVLWH